jgi:hypothetical protein
VVSYSSFGIDVLGQVIAGAAGEPYPRAVEDHLLRPMHMDGTHVGDRVDAAHDVVPYEPWRPAPEARIYHVPSAFPSIGITTTGKDVQRLMLALLDPAGGQGVITPAVQDDVFRTHEADGEFGAAHALVFELFRHRGRSVLQHGGISKNVSCYLALARELRAGLFYCHTDPKASRGAPAGARGPGRDAVRDAMSEMLRMGVTGAAAEAPPPAAWKDSWGDYVGGYLSVYRGYEGVLRLRSLLHADRVRVSRGARGLRVGDRDGLEEIAPGVFGAPDYEDTIAFHRDPRTGRMMFSRATGFNTYEQPPFLDDARIFLPLLAAAFFVAASGLAFALPRWKAVGSRHARAAAVAFAAVMVTGTGILYGFHALGEPYSVGTAWPILTVRVLGFLTVPAAALLSALAWRTFRRARGPVSRPCRLARLHLAALAVTAWTTVAVLVDFGLIGFSRLL